MIAVSVTYSATTPYLPSCVAKRKMIKLWGIRTVSFLLTIFINPYRRRIQNDL